MGQKVNPHGLRVGIIKDWDTKWYANKEFADYLIEDVNIRKFIKSKLYASGVSKILIERTTDRVKISVYTAKPGIVIGKNGEGDRSKTNPTILDNVTIGAGSVVAKDVSSNTIIAGNSAQVIKKYNFDKEIWEKTKED